MWARFGRDFQNARKSVSTLALLDVEYQAQDFSGDRALHQVDRYILRSWLVSGFSNLQEERPTQGASINRWDTKLRAMMAAALFQPRKLSEDIPTEGAGDPSVDGKCASASNMFLGFPMCRSNATTEDVRSRIIKFVDGLR